ncbi:MAG: hypothetical protein ACREP1_00505 [Rhodanobacteraceae bacterium]
MAEVFPVALASGYPEIIRVSRNANTTKRMKPLALSLTQQSRARHDDRARCRLPKFPRTDYHLHAPAQDVVALREQHRTVNRTELRAFRQISNEYLGEKTDRGYIAELLVFALVVGLIAWPLISLLIVLAQTANG